MPRWIRRARLRIHTLYTRIRYGPGQHTRLTSHHSLERMEAPTAVVRTADVQAEVMAEVDRLERPRGVAAPVPLRSINEGKWDGHSGA